MFVDGQPELEGEFEKWKGWRGVGGWVDGVVRVVRWPQGHSFSRVSHMAATWILGIAEPGSR